MKLAGELGATGTPLFVVGDRVMNGAVGYDTLKDAIAKARREPTATAVRAAPPVDFRSACRAHLFDGKPESCQHA